MHKQISLIRDIFIPKEMRYEMTAFEKYEYFRKLYNAGAHYILLNNVNVFGPFPRAIVPWDISEAQKTAIYNPEVTKVLAWINKEIIINLGVMTEKTLYVKIRIATGMLDKCNILKDFKILFHDNMARNLQIEHTEIIMSDLPFQGRKRKGDSYSPLPTIRLMSVTSLRD